MGRLSKKGHPTCLQAQQQGRGYLVSHKADNHYAIVTNILADKGKVSRKKAAVLLDSL